MTSFRPELIDRFARGTPITVEFLPSLMAKRAAGRRKAGGGSSTVLSRLRALETQVEQNRRDLDLQFRRIAQIQVELDMVKQAWAKVTDAAHR